MAGVRASGISTLLLTNEGAEALEGLYGSRQAQRVHARDQMVTGVSPATSPCGHLTVDRRHYAKTHPV